MLPNSYRPEIDGLRAIAVFAVVLYHAFPLALPGGYVGVDIFFVISGYLITKIIQTRIVAGNFSYKDFYAARVRRIFPALGIVLLFSFLFGYYYLLPADFLALGKHTVASAFFVANIASWLEAGYFDTSAIAKPLLHLWSLGVEEQFYAVWPITIGLIIHFRRNITGVLVLLFAISLVYSIFLTHTDMVAAYYSPLSRAWELCIGAIVVGIEARYHAIRMPFKPKLEGIVGIVALAAIGWATYYYDEKTLFPGLSALVPTLAAAALILFSTSTKSLHKNFLSWKPIVAIGLISYPFYLWHWPLISFWFIVNGEPPSDVHAVLLILLSVTLASLTYLLVERPIRKRKFARRISVPAALALVLITAALGGVAVWQAGISGRFPSEVQRVLAFGNYPYEGDGRYPTCWVPTEQPFEDTAAQCFAEAPVQGEDSIIVWGDSYSARFYAGLRQALPRAPITQLSRNSCPPLLEMPGDCGAENEKVIRYLADRADGSTLLMFGSWDNYGAMSPESDMASRLDKTLAEVSALNLKVVVIGPAPFWEEVLPSLVYRSWASKAVGRELPVRIADRVSRRPFDAEVTMRAIAKKWDATYVSLLDYLCSEDGCLTHVPPDASDLISWDHGHLTTHGARFVSKYVVQEIGAK